MSHKKNQGDDEIGLDNNEKAETLKMKNINNMQMNDFYFSSSGEPPRWMENGGPQ